MPTGGLGNGAYRGEAAAAQPQPGAISPRSIT
jgi:hypothetical protein